MKKFVVPAKLNIGGLPYIVQDNVEFDEDRDIMGSSSFPNLKIKLSHTSKGYEVSESQRAETLLHEVLHAVDYVYFGALLEEETIELITKAIMVFFKNNDFNLFDDKIPETITIFNNVFFIDKDYEFEDIEAIIQVNSNSSTIKVDSDYSHPTRTKFALFEICMLQLVKEYNLQDIMSEVEIKLRTLTTGLYQVFTANPKLLEIIKKYG